MTMITEGYLAGTTMKAEPTASRSLARARVGSAESPAGIIGRLLSVLAALVPMGYEDETGFHYGTEPYPVRSWEI